jgi:hypothetical protein
MTLENVYALNDTIVNNAERYPDKRCIKPLRGVRYRDKVAFRALCVDAEVRGNVADLSYGEF